MSATVFASMFARTHSRSTWRVTGSTGAIFMSSRRDDRPCEGGVRVSGLIMFARVMLGFARDRRARHGRSTPSRRGHETAGFLSVNAPAPSMSSVMAMISASNLWRSDTCRAAGIDVREVRERLVQEVVVVVIAAVHRAEQWPPSHTTFRATPCRPSWRGSPHAGCLVGHGAMNFVLVVVGESAHGVSCRWVQKRVDGIAACRRTRLAHVACVVEDTFKTRSLFGRFEGGDRWFAQQRETDVIPPLIRRSRVMGSISKCRWNPLPALPRVEHRRRPRRVASDLP